MICDEYCRRCENEKPQMIFFDYGRTLLYEPDWDSRRGNSEIMKYITKNPNNCTLDDILDEVHKVFGEIESIRRNCGYDISARVGNRLVYEHLGIEFSLTPLELETTFWTAASYGAVMPYADKMLEFLKNEGIRTAVISNNGWSGEALKERIDRLLPNNNFEFIISSCDYMIRKPDKRIFEVALQKAGITADKVWHCGDSFTKDVAGAKSVGIFPVLYKACAPGDTSYEEKEENIPDDFEGLYIHDWHELINTIKTL